jgi:predicted TIM-barrel fold metal-dependent hydrolase
MWTDAHMHTWDRTILSYPWPSRESASWTLAVSMINGWRKWMDRVAGGPATKLDRYGIDTFDFAPPRVRRSLPTRSP